MPEPTPLLKMTGIKKRFPGVVALNGVDFRVNAGEIHALMGQNGAGKSTLIKVLTGVHTRDAGEILVDGKPFSARSPGHAQELGVSTVYQEVNLIPSLSVAENLFLGRQPLRFGQLDWGALTKRAQMAVQRLDIDIDVSRRLSAYPIAIQQMVAIARALDVSARLLILDEPTSSLDAMEVSRLFALMRRLKADGIGIIFITHFLGQVYEISDRITVLRNGGLVGEWPTSELPPMRLVEQMLGLDASQMPEHKQKTQRPIEERRKPFFRAAGLGRRGAVEPFDLEVREGEVMGLAGLLGSGRTEVARLLFGADRADSGTCEVDGRPLKLASPRDAIRARFAFCPEDRKTEGLIPQLSVRENIVLALQAARGWYRRLSRKHQNELADRFIRSLQIATPDAEQAVNNLSGGNQQKVIVARWLASDPRLLILDEPTRGIDVGSKAEIQRLAMELAEAGKAVLLISSELEEISRCSTRVAVLRDRKMIAELDGGEVSEQEIMQTIASGHGSGNEPTA